MKKIILSAAVAAMAFSTTASALEDIKVSGQAKLWYETTDAGLAADGEDKSLFSKDSAGGEVVFKLGMTGKQGNVGFGATVYQTSTMGLEGTAVMAVRSNDEINSDMFVGEAYFTAPLVADTIMKFGKQELDTPLAFTERWNAVPNTFNAAVLLNSSVDNLTLVGAYVGQSTGSTATGNFDAGLTGSQFFGTAYAVAGLYNNDTVAANLWAYKINNVLSNAVAHGGVGVTAVWADAGMKAGPVDLKVYAAMVDHDGAAADTSYAGAISAGMKAGGVALSAAASTVTDGDLPVANTATGFKKTKLPTAGVYTDGLYVAQPGSTAVKVKAAGKLGTTGLALQGIMNMNSGDDGEVMGVQNAFEAQTLETSEVDLIVTQALGDFNLKGIAMYRTFDDSATDDARGGIYARIIASVNF